MMTVKVNRSGALKKLVFLLAGLGSLFAIALIILGVIFLMVGGSPPMPAAFAATATATVMPTATSLAGGIVVIPATTTVTPSPTVTLEPKAQTPIDTINQVATATRAPTATPSPLPVRRQPAATPQLTLDGFIDLVEPANDIQVLPDLVRFRWRWEPDKRCQPPPDGYAFEIRVWRDVDNADPMGAMDARAEKQAITCDPVTGVYSHAVGNLPSVPGTGGAKDGRFRWDVALVRLDPYQPVMTTNYRLFFYSK